MLIGIMEPHSFVNAADATQPALISSSSTVSSLSQYLVHPTTTEQANLSKVSVQPPVVEGNDNQDLEAQSSTIGDGSATDGGTLRLANDNEDIDPNTCVMCFTTYGEDGLAGNGAVWISFPCGRWLHEDCAEKCVADKDQKECYCPICIAILSAHAECYL